MFETLLLTLKQYGHFTDKISPMSTSFNFDYLYHGQIIAKGESLVLLSY